MAKKMTKAKIRKLAEEIRDLLLEQEMWVDVRIYFNGVAFSTDDGHGNYYYNDREHLVELPDQDPRWYFDYVGPYLSMRFEGEFYEVLNGYLGKYGWDIEEAFRELLKEYGLYYELGNAWNLSVYDL